MGEEYLEEILDWAQTKVSQEMPEEERERITAADEDYLLKLMKAIRLQNHPEIKPGLYEWLHGCTMIHEQVFYRLGVLSGFLLSKEVSDCISRSELQRKLGSWDSLE